MDDKQSQTLPVLVLPNTIEECHDLIRSLYKTVQELFKLADTQAITPIETIVPISLSNISQSEPNINPIPGIVAAELAIIVNNKMAPKI